mmetsp:Transcript_28237/g.70817  ORF Transcript_28237/g.70817 Transcript_28237/m.70817 type:complete len:211 (+) Transcript_28237:2845-3477(+)
MPQNDGVVEDKEDKHEREAEQQGQRQPDLQREGLALGNFDDDHGDEANREDDLRHREPDAVWVRQEGVGSPHRRGDNLCCCLDTAIAGPLEVNLRQRQGAPAPRLRIEAHHARLHRPSHAIQPRACRQAEPHLRGSEVVERRVYNEREARREAGDVARVEAVGGISDVAVRGAGGGVVELGLARYGQGVVQLAPGQEHRVSSERRQGVAH